MNSLAKQNDEQAIKYLASMRELYSEAKKYWGLTLIINIAVLPILSIYVVYNQKYSAYIALLSIFLLIINALLAILIKYFVKTAASVQELFDAYVFQIPINPILIENEDIKELVEKWSEKHIRKHTTKKITDWYASELLSKPQIDAVLTAQRINSWWDKSLRLNFTVCLSVIAGMLVFLMFILGLNENLSLNDFIIIVLLPAIPIMQLIIVEIYKNFEATKRAGLNLKRSKQLIRLNKINTVKTEEIRSLQDAIFIHRIMSPLIFDFIYWLSQKSKEKLMKRSSS